MLCFCYGTAVSTLSPPSLCPDCPPPSKLILVPALRPLPVATRMWLFCLPCVALWCVFVSSVDKQGIDRSHSWVNSAYAPGGSRAVLRRNPNSSCELKQVPIKPTPYYPALLPQTIHPNITWNCFRPFYSTTFFNHNIICSISNSTT